YLYNDQQFNNNIRVGIMHNWAFKFKTNHRIEFKNLYNQNSTSQFVNRTGPNYESFVILDNASYDQVYRGIYSGQILGNHDFNNGKTNFNWVVGGNFSYREQPDYKRYRSTADTTNDTRSLYVPVGAAAAEFFGRFYSNMTENSTTGALNFSQKVNFGNSRFIPTVKAGIFTEYKSRTFNARNIGYVQSSSSQFDQTLRDGTVWDLFDETNINMTTGIKIDEQSNPNDNYEASNFLTAGYLGFNLPITSKFNVITGVRVENNIQKLTSADVTNQPIEVSNPILNVFPSLNATYNLTEKVLVRGAYVMATNRPEFRELAPFGFYDFNFNFTSKGNPNLQTPIIHNADLRLEYYPSRGEVVSVAGFYKYFDNPIETIFLPGAGSLGAKNFSFANADKAYSAGVEFEIRKTFGFLGASKFLNDLSLGFNAAIIKSKISL